MPELPESQVAPNAETVPDPESDDVAKKAHEMLEILNDSPHQSPASDEPDSDG